MKRIEELKILLPSIRKDIAHAASLVGNSGFDSDFYLKELKSSISDLEKYISEYKSLTP